MVSSPASGELRAEENDPELRARRPDPALGAAAQASDLSYDRTIDLFLTGYAERPALGERAYAVEVGGSTGETVRAYQAAYRTITYRELQAWVKALAMAWRNEAKAFVRRGEFVGIIGFASIDYAILDLALAYAKAIPVPLSSHQSLAELREILLPTNSVALAISVEHLPSLTDLATQLPDLRSLLVFDHDPEVTRERLLVEEAKKKIADRRSNLQLVTLQSLIDRGKSPAFDFLPADPAGNDATALLIHTSGSTGKPKGACISARALINTWKNIPTFDPKVTTVLAPFHHMMGRDSMYTTLNAGGTAYFTLKADMSTLFEDIRLIRPTALTLFPRICEMIYQYFANANPADPRTSSFLGDRLRSITVASAPILPGTRNFIARSFGVPVHEGYSSTETASGGLAMNGHLNRNNVTDYKLRDVPESGYYSTDQPYPRGELCVKTRFGIRQYFKNPTATAELFDEEGFCRTGDIVEERGPSQIAIIDRRKDVLKLSQGEFVAVGRLGRIFEQGSPAIHQFYVHGDSRRAYLLAIVVPNSPLTNPEELKSSLRSEIHRIARENGLRSFEIPRDFLVIREAFSQENGLLSSVNKFLRPAIRNRYLEELEALYEAHEQVRESELDAFNLQKTALTTEEKLLGLVKTTLGEQHGPEAVLLSFQELGGDSLGAALLSLRIEKEFGVSLKGDQILSPHGNIQKWAHFIDNARGDLHPASFESIHGRNPTEIHGRDLQLSRFLSAEILIEATALPRSTNPSATVLLTGANGFLGGRLCLNWLEALAPREGKLICLVRSSSAHSARERLEERFAHYDPVTANRYRQLARNHLEVLPGDVSEPFLGLDRATYERLAREVDTICHGAALVNHVLPYEHLFRPNVIGTAEIIRFAITQKRKGIDFVSSIGVQSLTDRAQENSESSPLLRSVPLTNSYALGYFTSKWAGENLLRSAHLQTGIPVNVFRPSLIMPDRFLAGEMNGDDIVTRLVYSIILTRLAPESFDAQDVGFQVDGLPVDLLADSIVGLSDFPSGDFRVFNARNYFESIFPLEALVTCLESHGYKLRRIQNYQDWYDQMEKDLRALPPDQKSHSMFNVMEAYRGKLSPELEAPGCDHFQELLSKIGTGRTDLVFSDRYLQKYLHDLASLGLVSAEQK